MASKWVLLLYLTIVSKSETKWNRVISNQVNNHLS